MKTLLALAMLPCLAAAATAQGLVIPTEPDVPPLALVKHAVRVRIDHQAATTTVEQVFRNHTDRQLEAQYVFPIPRGASITKFTMLVNGKEQAGEMVEKNEARRIYNSIVQRSQDPGLLEHVGNDLFRANIFPILPRSEQRITITFGQVLLAQGPLVTYVYPVRGSQRHAPTVHGEFSLEADVTSPVAIRTIYSPSHNLSFFRKNDREARATFSERGRPLDRDVQLLFGLDEREIGLHGATFRPDPKDPGYFMMLMSPKVELPVQRIVERDLVFVVDVSGSMAGDKIKQARAALKHCLAALNDGDRFAIVPFSSYAEPWRKEWAGTGDRKAALSFADTLLAQGGTDIAGALDAALAYPRTEGRPFFVMFMTDGKPTLGETTDPKRILAKSQAAKGVRLFTWGVGYDVDAQLLDAMADASGGVSEYVRPEEDIEAKVSLFWGKTGRPVLTDLKVEVVGEKVQLANVFPRALPDLYAGSQIVLFGRYTGSGGVALRLSGLVNGTPQSFTYEMSFAEKDARHAFVEPLWARRRIGALLDQIRLHGETKELVDDVIRLSKEYGIQTPYTSALILETGVAAPVTRAGGGGAEERRALDRKAVNEEKLRQVLGQQGAPRPASAPAPEALAARDAQKETAKNLSEGFAKRDGAAAVKCAQYLKALKEGENGAAEGWAPVVRACKTNFRQMENLWVDDRFEAEQATTVVKFGSPAYFRILELRPELNEAFKVGSELVLVTAPKQALVVTNAGLETLEDEKIAALFR